MRVGDRQPTELLLDGKAWADEPRRLAEDVFGHRPLRLCDCGADSVKSRHLACGQCGRVAFLIDDGVYGSAVQVGCQFTAAGRRYNEENGVQW